MKPFPAFLRKAWPGLAVVLLLGIGMYMQANHEDHVAYRKWDGRVRY